MGITVPRSEGVAGRYLGFDVIRDLRLWQVSHQFLELYIVWREAFKGLRQSKSKKDFQILWEYEKEQIMHAVLGGDVMATVISSLR